MNLSLLSFARRYQRLLSFGIALCVLCAAGVSLAAITIGSSTTGVSAHVTYTNLTLNTPSSVPAGAVMIASIVINGGSAVAITAPSGWTQVARTDNDVNASLVTYWKIAGSSEPSNYTWVMNTQTRAVGGITPYSGVDTTNPIDTFAANNGFSAAATTTAITTSAANEEVIAVFGTDVSKTFGTPIGMTQEYTQTNGTLGPTIAANDMLQASTGSSGSVSSSIDSHKSRYWVAQQIALRPSVPTLTNDIVTYWKLDGNSNDSVGANNGTDSNVTYGTSYGKINQGALFDGTSSTVDTHLSLSDSQSASVSAWVKIPSTPTGSYIIFSAWDTSPKNFFLYLDNTGLHMQTGYNAVNASYTFTPGTWYLVTATSNWDGSNYHNDLYINGTNVGSNSSGGSFGGGSVDSHIGYMLYGGSPTAYFAGNIDELGVWDRALTSSEVSALYNGGSGIQYPF